VWDYDTGDSVLSSPALGPDGALVVGSDNGGVYCFRDRTLVDATPPTKPVVHADKVFITREMAISASWSALDPESGIQGYSFAIGTGPGVDDVVCWTDVGTAASMSRAGLPLAEGRSYYVSVVARNGASLVSEIGVSEPVVVVVGDAQKTIGAAKKRLAGTQVSLPGKVVTAVFDDCAFVEEADRSAGIRCVGPHTGIAVGSVVAVQGTVDSLYGETVLSGATYSAGEGTGSVAPLGMSCDMFARVGLDPLGLLARTAGRVTRVGSGYFVIWDGSYAASPRGGLGVEVRTKSGNLPPVGSFVGVTGIVCHELANSRVTTVIRAVPEFALATY
jgi:hypothetical protein